MCSGMANRGMEKSEAGLVDGRRKLFWWLFDHCECLHCALSWKLNELGISGSVSFENIVFLSCFLLSHSTIDLMAICVEQSFWNGRTHRYLYSLHTHTHHICLFDSSFLWAGLFWMLLAAAVTIVSIFSIEIDPLCLLFISSNANTKIGMCAEWKRGGQKYE